MFCAQCGAVSDPDDRFCSSCGAPNTSPPPPPSMAAPGQSVPVPPLRPPETSASGFGSVPPPPSKPPTSPVQPAPLSSEATSNIGTTQTKRSIYKNPIALVAAAGILLSIIGVIVLGGSSNSAQSTASAMVAAIQTGDWAKWCSLTLPSQRSTCSTELGSLRESVPNIRLSYVTVNGDHATAVTSCSGASQYCNLFAGPKGAQDLVKQSGTWSVLYAPASPASPATRGTRGTRGTLKNGSRAVLIASSIDREWDAVGFD